ncbi:MAG: AAA family ATPase, partial [Candidatus Methanofastidiosia archaeon]
IAPVTVLYGPNGSGKSTLFHALAFMKNVISNPAQQVDSFFNTGVASFGGFEQVVLEHIPTNKIELKICSESGCILTTDSKLKEKLSIREELTVYLADQFLDQYDC